MEIIVKEAKNNNLIYLMDIFMRPLTIEVISKTETILYLKKIVLEMNINHITFLNEINLELNDSYYTDNFKYY